MHWRCHSLTLVPSWSNMATHICPRTLSLTTADICASLMLLWFLESMNRAPAYTTNALRQLSHVTNMMFETSKSTSCEHIAPYKHHGKNHQDVTNILADSFQTYCTVQAPYKHLSTREKHYRQHLVKVLHRKSV